MDYIGNRISILRKENELSIVILSFQEKTKNLFLLIWFSLWSLSGIVMLTQYFSLTDPNTKTVIIVWIGFWAYFEYKIFIAYRWRKYGKEIIKIRDGKLMYKRDVAGKGKTKEYAIDFIKDLRYLEPAENSFFENLNDSYWVIGNEKIGFDYYGAEIKFGMQLDAKDATALIKLIKSKTVG
jgi:hypothetical protein